MHSINNEVKQVTRGGILAVLVVISVSIIPAYLPVNLFSPKKPVVANKSKKDSVHIIINIEGQNLFKENCSACHRLYGRVDGPSIKGAADRVKDRALLREWIRNSSKVLKSGNPYFNNLVTEYGVMMPDFPQLTNEQVDAILAYLKEVEAQD